MANPQKEDGFVAVSNELLERLYQSFLPRRQLAAMLCILRITYGYNRKEAEIPSVFLAEQIGTDESNARKILVDLMRRNLIVRTIEASGSIPATYTPQKNWELWVTDRIGHWPELLGSKCFSPGYHQPGKKHPLRVTSNPERNTVSGLPATRRATSGVVKTTRRIGQNDPENRVTDDPENRVTGNPESDQSNGVTTTKNDHSPVHERHEYNKDMYPPTPQGGTGGVGDQKNEKLINFLQEALTPQLGHPPTRQQAIRVSELYRRPTPDGWDAKSWRQHISKTFSTTLQTVKDESRNGRIGDIIAVTCTRTHQIIGLDSTRPEENP